MQECVLRRVRPVLTRADVLHGFVFSFFFTGWLEADGPKHVFLALGGVQLACMLFSIPMYVLGKRTRLWTARRNLMARL